MCTVYSVKPKTLEVSTMAKNHPEINDEIIAIEKGIVALSSSFSPFHSVANFEKIKAKLELKHSNVVQMKPRNWSNYMGWAAAIVLIDWNWLSIPTTRTNQ